MTYMRPHDDTQHEIFFSWLIRLIDNSPRMKKALTSCLINKANKLSEYFQNGWASRFPAHTIKPFCLYFTWVLADLTLTSTKLWTLNIFPVSKLSLSGSSFTISWSMGHRTNHVTKSTIHTTCITHDKSLSNKLDIAEFKYENLPGMHDHALRLQKKK